MKLSLYVPLNVQTQRWAWIKLATDNFSTVKNLRNTCDCAPLSWPRVCVQQDREG